MSPITCSIGSPMLLVSKLSRDLQQVVAWAAPFSSPPESRCRRFAESRLTASETQNTRSGSRWTAPIRALASDFAVVGPTARSGVLPAHAGYARDRSSR